MTLHSGTHKPRDRGSTPGAKDVQSRLTLCPSRGRLSRAFPHLCLGHGPMLSEGFRSRLLDRGQEVPQYPYHAQLPFENTRGHRAGVQRPEPWLGLRMQHNSETPWVGGGRRWPAQGN